MDFSLQPFWIPLLKIIWINIALSEDKAVVIAPANRRRRRDAGDPQLMSYCGSCLLTQINARACM